MSSDNLQASLQPPSLMRALTDGFDAISNHVGLVLFGVVLDLALWFGPRLRLVTLSQKLLEQITALPEAQSSLPQTQNTQMIERFQEMVQGFNLFSVLRTFPVGIPSLLVGRLPVENPVGSPLAWEVDSLGLMVVVWLLLTAVGLIMGALYFLVVAQATLSGKVNWRLVLEQWPWVCMQIILLAVAWILLLVFTFVPFSCMMSVFVISGFGMEQVVLLTILIFIGLLIWIVVPLFFSPHGVVVHRSALWVAVLDSARITRLTLPSTSLLLLVFVVLSEGLSIVWSMPVESSWWLLVGILGHAFIATSLLAASFVYYRDADLWMRETLHRPQPSFSLTNS